MLSEGANPAPARKRRRRLEPPAPAFCDAAATVAAGPFAARRLPELRVLWQQTVASTTESPEADGGHAAATALLESGGRKIAARHLRRRASSHASRKRHRFPRGNATVEAARTTDPTATQDADRSGNGDATKPLPCRRTRRKPARLRLEHEYWAHDGGRSSLVVETGASEPANATGDVGTTEPPADDATSATTSADAPRGTRWIPTHLWHAKRFRLATLWGWRVPLLHGQRGAQAALRLLTRDHKMLLQDVSWAMQPTVLRVRGGTGPRDDAVGPALSVALKRILPDFSLSLTQPTEIRIQDCWFHDMDRQPLSAIGPARVCWARDGLMAGLDDGSSPDRDDESDGYYLYFWTHPSIQTQLLELLARVVEALPQGLREKCDGPRPPRRGTACFRLRGRALAACLQTAIAYFTTDAAKDANPDTTYFTDDMVSGLREGHATELLLSCAETPTRLVLLPSSAQFARTGILSVDIFLSDMEVARKLFLALILRGGACPIGIVEEAYLLLDATPPCPLFPRDYPDTIQGENYWTATSNDWGIVRRHWEGGGGRISADRAYKLKPTQWTRVLDNESEEHAVAMRGAFGRVLYGIIQAAGNLSQTSFTSDQKPPCKKRRRSRPPWLPVHVPPLSKEKADQHEQMCLKLIQSLTLPAVVLCHVTVYGRAKPAPGSAIRSMTDCDDKNLLGFVTHCAFSPSRGMVHGFAVCGVARWIKALAVAQQHGALLAGKTELGTSIEIQLGVKFFNNDKNEGMGSLSLIL